MIDFALHNQEAASVWAAYHSGRPIRMPMLLSYNPRMVLLDPRYSKGLAFADYYADPRVMMQVQCDCTDLMRQNLFQDWDMGSPDGYTVYVDFQNDFESCWLGAELRFSDNNVPFVQPFLHDDNRNLLFERGVPDPFGGFAAKAWSYYECMQEQREQGALWNGKPIRSVLPAGMGTDGPMTLACMIRGTTEFCIDLYEEPEWAQQLLSFLTEAAIARVKAYRRRLGLPERSPGVGFADDSILLLSEKDYRELILPHHKRLVEELSTGEQPNSIHLCGDASRHFVTIRDELHVRTFDTGFPVDHERIARNLGPEVQIQGGPHVDLLRHGTPAQVAAETRRIIEAVRPYTRRFIMKEANNLAPQTPFANIRAMYETVREYGVYEENLPPTE